MNSAEHAKVAIIGAGPAGVGAAVQLARLGIGPVALIEREREVGGISARYTSDDVPTYILWTLGRVVPGYRYAGNLRKALEKTNVALYLESTVIGIDPSDSVLTIVSPDKGRWQLRADAILLACGARESSRSERGWIFGHRPAGVYFTTNILDLAARSNESGVRDAAVIGSEVMGYAAAAKLARLGAKRLSMADASRRPQTILAKRLYFYRWALPRWIGGVKTAVIRGCRAVEGVETAGTSLPAREVAITGAPGVKCYRLANTDIFLAGNVLGLNCSGNWAYWTGKWAARRIAKLL
jgi:NADPH-dependent 2,4-dienoyl-CoA reductase/sulfur reductase-like enzyme